LREADAYAKRWLAGDASLPSDVAGVAVELAARRGSGAMFEALHAALGKAKTPYERGLALRAMADFVAPETLRRALDLALGGEVRLSELGRMFYGALRDPATRPLAVDWMKTSWDALRAKLKGRAIGQLASAIAGACTAEERDGLATFLGGKLAGVEAARRRLDEATERAGLCIALRAADAGAVTAYFKP
jgi:hypothetical protein